MTTKVLPTPLDPLAQLKDIHLPTDPISWWPLATGWWILCGLFFILIAVGIYFYLRSKQLTRQELIVQQALAIFSNLQTDSLNTHNLIKALSELLRRTAISLYGRKHIAHLVGENWLLFLNDHGTTTAFTEGIGRALADQPYRREANYDRQQLLNLIHDWLKKQPVELAKKV